jgi:hypothetical protein
MSAEPFDMVGMVSASVVLIYLRIFEFTEKWESHYSISKR